MGKAKDISSDEDITVETNEVSPQKRHKKHKHKKHKKKKITHDDNDSFNDVTVETDKKKTFRVKIKKDDDKSLEKPREKMQKTSNLNTVSASPSPKTATKKKVLKNNKGKDSGTSSEEERWLDAIESGKLEEVDDELKKIKPKDPKLMTARQRAMFERKTDTEPNPAVEQLMSLPTGYKEKVMTAEAIQKAALKSLKRKQLADEKREKDKKKTMERLLKKQESKASKVISKGKPSRRQVPLVTYRLTLEGSSISLPPGEDFPLQPTKEKEPSIQILCGVNQCKNLKKYSCSKTGIPLCSLECYKANLSISV
ncbi:INO80 complex subunit B isoform X1 [Apis mellifera caucasica]|uniref:INO80 complex subunit B isoform X1 n=1 Tax=Apis mellifera TaxID=7460 RepID=A0A7M7GF06_APIME|nr:INO80 complex subunit B isoform X1 [Apis mellifera]KAG6799563.1 INO80 complex subunit B isoform X1 [Apis mellifera caucasica]KAG9432931.1 INO80 complex subunit B isoform X1 [Apis mellifera carnica]|eukprot:XP_003251352.1 INO80 complex subunit B isoform X1 [Apis mellifera]